MRYIRVALLSWRYLGPFRIRFPTFIAAWLVVLALVIAGMAEPGRNTGILALLDFHDILYYSEKPRSDTQQSKSPIGHHHN